MHRPDHLRTHRRTSTGTDPGADPRLATWWSDLANTSTNGDDDQDGRTDGPASYRCEGLDGRPVDPTEAVAATLLVGHIRRRLPRTGW
ncbi:MAG: hypothetical protein U0P45_15770 [Acidimicrobiales bacterium]